MKRPVVHVTIRDEASGKILHTETKSAFNSGIRASEAAVRKIALSERAVYEGERPSRTGDPKFGGSVYTRRWVSKTGRAIIATIEKEASGLEEAPRARRGKNAETAGIEYATNQLESDYFMDWVRDQLLEASRMPQDEVLPLETKSDARVIAKNMLKQLEWDTKRDLKESKEFFDGFSRGLHNPSTVSWLADELLQIKGEMGGGRVKEAPRSGLTENERAVLQAIANSEYQHGQGEALIGTYVYSEGIADAAGINRRSVAGVFSSLSKKGLINTAAGPNRSDDTVSLTAAGLAALGGVNEARRPKAVRSARRRR